MASNEKTIPVPFPHRGYSGFVLNKDKPAEWAQDAENVVGEFPGTGKRQGGQRPGRTRFTTAPLGGPVQAGISVAHDNPPFDFAQLGNPVAGGSNGAIQEEWKHVSPQVDEALDVRVDGTGNSYFLTSSGTIIKRNGAGEVVYTASLPVTPAVRPAPRFALDGTSILAGGNSNGGGTGAVLWRLAEDENRDGLFLAFTLPLEANEVVAIEVDGSTARVAVNYSDESAAVLTVLGVDGDVPAIVATHNVPYPVGDLAIGPRGVYACSRPSATRGSPPAGDGFQESQVDWTPADLTNAQERLHAWYDSDYAGQVVNGGRMFSWPDYRLSGEIPVPFDTTDRTLQPAEYTLFDLNQGPNAPVWRQDAAGPHAGVNFNPVDNGLRPMRDVDRDNGRCLQTSNLNILNSPLRGKKSTAEGIMSGSRGLYPLNSEGYKFAICFTVRWRVGAPPGVVWLAGCYRDAGAEPAALNNGLSPGASWLALCLNDDGSATAVQADGEVCLRGPASGTRTATATSHGSTALRMAIITIVNNGSGSCSLRVNGEDQVTGFTIDDSGFVAGTEFFGNRVYYEGDSQLNAAFLPGTDSLHGTICSAVTIFGDTTSDVHDTNVTSDEVERLEGYMAWRFGCASDALESGHTYKSAPPSGSGAGPLVGETARAMRSQYGILYKLDPAGEGVVWAIDGAGIGYAVETDENGGVFCMGPRAVPPSYPETRLGPLTRTHLKVIDRGQVVQWRKPSRGRIRFSGDPADGDYFTIHDGVNEHTFEWHSGAGTISGATVIDNGSGDINGHAQVAVAALVLATEINVDAIVEGIPGESALDVAIYSREDSTATERPIDFSATAGAFDVVEGMTGPGTPPTNTWANSRGYAQSPTYPYARMDVDFDGDLYIPWTYPLQANHISKYAGDTGVEQFTHTLGGSASVFDVHAVAVDTRDRDLFPAEGPEFMWAAGTNINSADVLDETRQTQYKLRLISSTPNGESSRRVSTIVVANGDVFSLAPTGVPTRLQSASVSTTTKYVDTFEMFGEVFLVDTGKYRVVNLRSGEVKVWQPKTAGEMPEGGRMGVSYRGRAVIARTKDDPHGIYASAMGDPYDWDVARSLDDPTGAFAGISTKRNPDLIQALAPFYDDALIVGGASTITQFKGDLSTEGSIDLFTTATGMAFGRSWALAPNGLLYFFGSRGGVWVMQPGTDGRANPPVEVTEQTVGREMANVDLSLWEPLLLWDTDRDGLHVILTYRGSASNPTPPRHWFYEADRKAWWPVTHASGFSLPTTIWTQHGDTKDARVTMVGHRDGHLRYIDDSAANDDGNPIDSYVLMGPLGSMNREYGLLELQMGLSKASGGVNYRIYASNDPEELGTAIHSGATANGFSGSLRARGRGSNLWFKVGSAALEESWGLGELAVTVKDDGERRRRNN